MIFWQLFFCIIINYYSIFLIYVGIYIVVMKIFIMGGVGFIGQFLVRVFLDDSQGKYEVVFSDIVEFWIFEGVKWFDKVKCVKVDFFIEIEKVVLQDFDVVFIFYGIMFLGVEVDFDLGKQLKKMFDYFFLRMVLILDLGMRVNFDVMRVLFDMLC